MGYGECVEDRKGECEICLWRLDCESLRFRREIDGNRWGCELILLSIYSAPLLIPSGSE